MIPGITFLIGLNKCTCILYVRNTILYRQYSKHSIMRSFILTFGLLLLILPSSLSAQGCSDAGLCTLGQLEDSITDKNATRISLTPSFGIGERFIGIFSPVLDFEQDIGDFRLAVKVPYMLSFGKEYNANGVGDITLSASYLFLKGKGKGKVKEQASFTAGIKLPSGKTNKQDEGLPLPMAFQTGLGSTDLILALNYSTSMLWAFGLAYQHPLEQDNENEFLPVPEGDDFLVDFYPSRKLERAPDLMFRADKHFSGENLKWRAGVITVYHLDKDSYLNEAGVRTMLEDSQGITINVNGGFSREIRNQLRFELLMGVPVYARDDRPDGLTRNLVLLPKFTLTI